MDKRAVPRQHEPVFENAIPALKWDVRRLLARSRSRRMVRAAAAAGPLPRKLHIGCGTRRVPGWLNCDVRNSDVDIDLAAGQLPFADGAFDAVCAQHVIEHLRLGGELETLLRETRRCLAPGGEIWLSCPDMKKIATSYLADGGTALLQDRLSRWPGAGTGDYPASHVVNLLFNQWGEHKNLFDIALLDAVLTRCGFADVTETDEAGLLARFPAFPPRNDDASTLYVRARRA